MGLTILRLSWVCSAVKTTQITNTTYRDILGDIKEVKGKYMHVGGGREGWQGR